MNWNIDWLALDGALGGIAVGSVYELGEAYFQLPNKIEPPTHYMAEIAVAGIAGAFLCAIISLITNRLKAKS
ncbi:hypothetical protein [Microvirga sp. G4-2]|uniref:hypothetical protein n=1 Tax=Microvirga sp. G4-2 TaxID=3434467 RepID=UPI0040447181